MATEKVNNYVATMDKKDLLPSQSIKASPPPSYVQPPVNITSNLANLNLEPRSTNPTVDQSIAHLKLLEAFHELREDVATTDGLFGISDDFASKLSDSSRTKMVVRLREKRWAVYVARAADRFETWWETCIPSTQQRLKQTDVTGVGNFHWTPEIGRPMEFTNTPPLGR